MNKEQTPLTAYDLKIMFVEDTGLTTYSYKKEYIEWLEQKVLNREQYAQAKVLEALEREVPKAYLSWYEGVDDLAGDKYYETEVKPKYSTRK